MLLPREIKPLLPLDWARIVLVIRNDLPAEGEHPAVIEESILSADEKIKYKVARDPNYDHSKG